MGNSSVSPAFSSSDKMGKFLDKVLAQRKSVVKYKDKLSSTKSKI